MIFQAKYHNSRYFNFVEILSQRIKEARQLKGLTQIELSALLNVKQNTISQYETGASEPSAEMISKIARALDCDPNFLFGFDG